MTGRGVRISFEQVVVDLPLDALLPLRQITPRIVKSRKYERIATSVREVGVIEPIVVARRDAEGRHLLLDGHLRYHVLREDGHVSARCIISDDDEAFTYNKRVNRLATVQEHYMISRAIDRGVPPEMIAKALGIDTKAVMRRRNMLDGISPDVAELLKDKNVSTHAFDILRKMKPLRQFEAAELMASVGNYTSSYAKAILAATKQSDLAKPERPKEVGGMTPEQMARMERELESVNRDFKAVEDTFGDDVLHLVLASRYLSRIVGNQNIAAYIDKRHPEILAEFRTIIAVSSLDTSI
jgi:ParB-like chromosome segregation protein Spo0J